MKFNVPDLQAIEAIEISTNRFAQGLNFYKLFWIFFIGCFLGVVIETVFCFATKFKYESRVGLIYGPFNLVYGFGALSMALGLHWLRTASDIWVIIGGAIIGSIVEYVCALVQGGMFKSKSWDYSDYPFNLGGKVNLLYSLFWGFLGIAWIKIVYPFFASWILKIPNYIGVTLTWVLFAFMLLNTIMTVLAVKRWEMRLRNLPNNTPLSWKYFDKHYHNDKMKRIFPSMVFENIADHSPAC